MSKYLLRQVDNYGKYFATAYPHHHSLTLGLGMPGGSGNGLNIVVREDCRIQLARA